MAAPAQPGFHSCSALARWQGWRTPLRTGTRAAHVVLRVETVQRRVILLRPLCHLLASMRVQACGPVCMSDMFESSLHSEANCDGPETGGCNRSNLPFASCRLNKWLNYGDSADERPCAAQRPRLSPPPTRRAGARHGSDHASARQGVAGIRVIGASPPPAMSGMDAATTKSSIPPSGHAGQRLAQATHCSLQTASEPRRRRLS